MSGYVIAQIDLKNKEGYKEYAEKVPNTVKNFGGEYLVRAGEFKKLEGEWRFIEIEEGSSRIELELHYEFKNFILEKLISPAFTVIANTFIDSFYIYFKIRI